MLIVFTEVVKQCFGIMDVELIVKMLKKKVLKFHATLNYIINMTGLSFINNTADNLLTLPSSILYTNSNLTNQPDKKRKVFLSH